MRESHIYTWFTVQTLWNTLEAKHQQFLNLVRLLTNIKKHVGFNSFLLFFHFSSHWFRWWFLKKFSYAKKKYNGRELLIHLVNLREKTQSLSFLSDLGSLWIELSLLAPRSSLLGTSPGTSLATRSEERGARSEERGARSEERQLYWQVMILVAGFALLTFIK